MQTQEVYLGQDKIFTDSVGVKQLLEFYNACVLYRDCIIHVKLDNLLWLDGNLCALLGALMFRLSTENNLKFGMDAEEVNKKCSVLFHNDFLKIEQNIDLYKKKTCIPFKGFYPKQKNEFTDYLEYELLSHNAMPKFSEEIKGKLIDDLIEVYGNIDKHAETELPFFVCGQHYPRQELVRFTICDLGVGFYKKIKESKPDLINSCGEAILWAVAGNSTKTDAPGGKGLKNLHEYVANNKGGMQIFSGDANWCSKTMQQNIMIKPNGITQFVNSFLGSAISLEFNKKILLS